MSKTETITKKMRVAAGTTVEEILALDEKGVEVVFPYEEDFIELSDEDVEKLGRLSARQYFIAEGAHKAWVKQQESEKPTRGLQILDPLGASAGNKLKILRKLENGKLVDVSQGWVDAQGKKWHPCWKRPDEIGECESMGYVRITQESDPDILTRGATGVSSSRVIARKDGSDDLIAMKIPQRIYLEHINAVALASQERAGATMRELTGKLKDVSRRIEVEDTSDEITAVIGRGGERIVEE
jgi:hypothetical protein